jgi:hypothetical protein
VVLFYRCCVEREWLKFLSAVNALTVTVCAVQKIDLEPLSEDHTPFEAQLRKDLQRVMTTAKGMTPNEMHRSLNATAKVLHAFCKTYAGTLDVSPRAVCCQFCGLFSLPLSTGRASFIADIACFKSVHWELIPLILTGCPV